MGFAAWAAQYWRVFKKPELHLPTKYIKTESSKIMRLLLFLVGTLAWAFLAFAITVPREPLKYEKSKIEANDLIFVVDVSRSMLAEDFKPNRLEAAKEKIREFVKYRPTDRIGIVIFAEKAFTLLPLTTDLKLIEKLISEIKTGFLGGGTNIGDALGLAAARLAKTTALNKVVIFLTDGVSNVGNLTPKIAAEEAAKIGVKVYTIGIGGDKNARIPLGRGVFGMRYQNIPGGSIDVKTLQMISDMTGGKSYIAKDIDSLKNVFEEIQDLEKTEIETSSRIVYRELYVQYLMIGGILLVLVELLGRLGMREVT